MKKSLILTAALGASLFTAHADTYKLKDGRSFEGKIAMETEDSYILLVEVQKGVRDEITVKKSEIESISKEDKSHKAFAKIPKLLPTADLLAEKDYLNLISTHLTPFLKKYPESEHLSDVKKLEATLLSERSKVMAGELKINGKWLTDEDSVSNKYEIEAALALQPVRQYAKKGEFGAALTVLASQEKVYQNTQPFRNALEMSLRFLPLYKARAQKIVSNADALIKKRDLSLTRLSSADKFKVTKILTAEESAYQAQLKKADQGRGKWLPLNRFHSESAATVLKSIESESKRLQKKSSAQFNDAGALYRDVLKSIDKNELDLAKTQLAEFIRTRPPQEHTKCLSEKYATAKEQMKLIEQQKKAEATEELRKAKEEAKRAAKEKKREAKEAKEAKETNKIDNSTSKDSKEESSLLDKLGNSSGINKRNKMIEEISQ